MCVWVHACVCGCRGWAEGMRGVASLEVVNRIIKRTVVLPRRQK